MVVLCISAFGCTSLAPSPLPKTAIQIQVGRFIERSAVNQRAEKAAYIIAIAEGLAARSLENDIGMGQLRVAATAELTKLGLATSEQLLWWNLIDAVQENLEAGVRQQTLPADIRLAVREVLGWITEAASLYTTPSLSGVPRPT